MVEARRAPGPSTQARRLARVSYLIRLGGHTTTTYDISGLGARAGSTPPPSEPPSVTWCLTALEPHTVPRRSGAAGSDQWAAQEVAGPVLQSKAVQGLSLR